MIDLGSLWPSISTNDTIYSGPSNNLVNTATFPMFVEILPKSVTFGNLVNGNVTLFTDAAPLMYDSSVPRQEFTNVSLNGQFSVDEYLLEEP